MGLGAPRKRKKISSDPNNTVWSRSSSKFGQRILQSQGWRPGDLLGVDNAPYAKLHGAASASHIKVGLKDDTLGLGAKTGANHDGDTTGLNNFQDLLGRLNGKSDVVIEKEQISRESVRKKLLTEHRWGKLNFVSGGLLVGDRLQEFSEVPEQAQSNVSDSDDDAKDPCINRALDKANVLDADRSSVKYESHFDVSPSTLTIGKNQSEKSKRRAEKEDRKLQRKLRREAKQSIPTHISQITPESPHASATDCQEQGVTINMSQTHQQPVKTVGGRHAVRQRYIHQKKMAVIDSKALNEILMIKA